MSRSHAESTPSAVVVGSDLNALGVVRSLAAAGVPTVVIGPVEGCAMRSRYGRKVPLAKTHSEALISALRLLPPDVTHPPVLFLTEEKSVETVSERRDQLGSAYRIRMPSHQVMTELMDKTTFQLLAQRAGHRIPDARPLRSIEDLPSIAELRFPCVLKPAWKNYAYGARFRKAYVVATPDEVAGLYREIAPVMPEMIVQEWIDGDDADIYFCLQYVGMDGELVASFVGRKLRSWPPRIGGTASCAPAPDHAQELTDTTLRFFRNVRFEGMGSMEYKRDRRDGRFYMIEPTVGRTDFQEEVATVNGVNIPLSAYRYESGQTRAATQRVSPPRLWRESVIDRWAREQQENPAAGEVTSHRKVDAYFRMSDPGPWLDNVRQRIGDKMRALIQQVR